MFTNNENKTLADIYTAMLEAKKQEAKADNEIEVDGESEVSDKGASTEKSDDPAADNTPAKKKKEDDKEPVEEASCKSKKEGLDPVGKADADIDNDGDVDDSDKYLHNRRKAIKKAMKESFADRSAAREEVLRAKIMEHVGSRSLSEEEIEMFARRLGMRVADVKTLLKYPTEDQDAQTNVTESVELNESSTRDYVDNILPKALKKAGIPYKVSKKTGYTSYKCGDYEIVNDGVGIKVKENGKEIAYYSKPKLDYKKAVQQVNEDVELTEAKFKKGDSVKIKNVKKYDALAKNDEGTVIGMMSGKVMVKVGTGQMNVDPKDLVLESAELDEAQRELTPKDVEAHLVKKGVNPKDAKDAVKKGFAYANKKYGGPTYAAALKKVAEVVWSLHEEVELDEALERDGPKRTGLKNFALATGKKGKEYQAKKAQQRKDMNAKNDPGAAKKHLALSVLDKEKARAKAKKKGANPSEFEYAVGHKPNKMTLTQKGLDPKKARSGKKLPESVELEESVIDVCSKINGRAMMRMDAEDVVAKLTPADMKDIARNKAQFLKTCKHKEKDVIFSMVSEIQG